MLTSRSSMLVAVVMIPVLESMLNCSNPSRSEYLSLTWSVPCLSLSVAFTFPTTVPVGVNIITTLNVAVKQKEPAEFSDVLFLTYFAFLSDSAQY